MNYPGLKASGSEVASTDAGTARSDRVPPHLASEPDFPVLCESCHATDASVIAEGFYVCAGCSPWPSIPRELMAE